MEITITIENEIDTVGYVYRTHNIAKIKGEKITNDIKKIIMSENFTDYVVNGGILSHDLDYNMIHKRFAGYKNLL
jgi:hypothetical protein